MAEPAAGPVPTQALEYFRSKSLRVGFDYRDVWLEEHGAQFTAAKVTQLDVLADIQRSLGESLERGESFRTWAQNIRPELQRKGWWGEREVTDPVSGDTRITDLSSPQRLRTLYDTNLRQARAAGQWQRIQRTKRALPYLLYQIGPSLSHRAEHVAWHGTVLPADDPFWDTHMPMNGWGCKCHVRQVGPVEYERLQREGLATPVVVQDRTGELKSQNEINPDTNLPTGRLIQQRRPIKTTAPPLRPREWLNKRTGAVERIPAGIDPGFNVNAGVGFRVDLQARAYLQKLTRLPPQIGAVSFDLVRDRVLPVVARDFQRFAAPVLDQVDAGNARTANRVMTVGAMKPPVVEWLKDQLGIEPRSAAIVIRDQQLAHLYRGTKQGRGATLSREDILRLPAIIDDPEQVLWDASAGNEALLYVFASTGRSGKVVVRLDYIQRQTTAEGDRLSTTVNPIRSAGLIQPENLRGPNFRTVMKR